MTPLIGFTRLDDTRSNLAPSSKSIDTVFGVVRQPNPLLFAAADAAERVDPDVTGRLKAVGKYIIFALEGRGVYYSKAGFVLTAPTVAVTSPELGYGRLLAMAHAWDLHLAGTLHPWFSESLEEIGWDWSNETQRLSYSRNGDYATLALVDMLGYSLP